MLRYTHTRKVTFSILGAVVALGLLGACDDNSKVTAASATSESVHDNLFYKYANNPESEKRITFFAGFSFLPPQGEHWIEGPRQPEPDPNDFRPRPRIIFNKILPQNEKFAPHTVFAMVNTIRVHPQAKSSILADPRGYLEYVLKLTIETDKVNSSSGRTKVISQKGELMELVGRQCLRYDIIAEDRGVVGYRGTPLKLDYHSIQCLAPSGDFLVGMIYSQRTPPELEPVDITREGEDFLMSLRFSGAPLG
jgi:hypothetical protein